MKIDEIYLYPDRDSSLERYTSIFQDSEKEKAFGNLEFSEVIWNDGHHLGLFEDDTLVSYLELDKRDIHFQVTISQTDKKFQGRGCFRYLLIKAVKEHNEILSDTRQTEAAKRAWKSLIRYQGGGFQIFIYDTENNNIIKRATDSVPDEEIWDNENIVLMIKKPNVSKKIAENVSIRNNKLKAIGRNEDNLWFGPNSSNENYINP